MIDVKNKHSVHPEWVLKYKRPNTEIKFISGRYYLYGVKSVYDKITKRSKKISLEILGSITQQEGFVPSQKQELKEKSEKTYHKKEALAFEYGLSKWICDAFGAEDLVGELKKHFPDLWQFIIIMTYCRVGYQSPLKNIPFH